MELRRSAKGLAFIAKPAGMSETASQLIWSREHWAGGKDAYTQTRAKPD